MSSISAIGAGTAVVRTTRSAFRSSSASASRRKLSAARVGVRDFMSRLVTAGEAIQKLKRELGDASTGSVRVQKARAAGETSISLGSTTGTLTLSSTEEVSTVTTEIDDRNPPATKPQTTSLLTIHGTYTGTTASAFTLESDSVDSFTVGQGDPYTFTLTKDGSPTSILVPGGTAPGDRIAIGDGLEISFTAGDVFKKETFAFNALTGIDVLADTTVPLDGSAGETNLDSAVTGGTFTVNGELITVSSTDTIDGVLAAINASSAGVSATYDSVADEVTLTATDSALTDIVLDNDDSGFLAAMKLDTATATGGEADEVDLAMDQVSALSGVASGELEINGVRITLDVTTDSLQDLMDQVDASSADAELVYSSNTGRLMVRSKTAGDDLVLSGDTTGLLAAFGIDEGTTEAEKTQGMRADDRNDLIEQVNELVELMNDMTTTVQNESLISDALETARDSIRSAIKGRFTSSSSDADITTDIGMSFIISTDKPDPFMELGTRGTKTLTAQLKRNPSDAMQVLFGDKDDEGLLDAILTGMDKAQKGLINKYGSVGLLLDITA